MNIRCLFMGVNILSISFLAVGEESICIKPGSSYVCLSGGSGSHEGNVYVHGEPVCDDNWDIKDGNVVCKQLKFQRGAVQVFTKTHFSEYMSGIFGMDEVECNGNEANITNCYHSQRDDCGPGEAAGVLCDNSSPEEVDREAQLMSDCYAEDVGYSSRDKMAEEKAVALATQCQDWCVESNDCLHFSFDKTTKICSRYSGNTKVPRDNFISGPRVCPPQDLNINCTSAIINADCSSMGVANCNICLKSSDIDLQVEEHIGNVFVNNKAVCDDEWDIVDGHVICKQLGYPGGARTIYSGSKYGLVLSEFSMDNVDCSGTEQSLTDCNYTKTDNCDSGEAAGVVCDHREDFIIAREKECFINDLTYSTDNHIAGEDVAEFPNKCQSLCSNVEGCSHFTWFMDGHKCLFFNRTGVDNGKLKEMGAISGPRKCPDIQMPEGCTSDDICLVGGNDHEGNVMVRRQPVCDDDWDLLDAHIACKQLGFQRASGFTLGSKYGLVPRNFSLDNLNCSGNEITLDHCQHADIEDCDSNEGAGVICDQRNEKTIREEGDLMTEQCFVKDVVYGSLLNNDFIYLPTVLDCQMHCINDSECSTFSYNNKTEECQKRKSVSTNTGIFAVPQCSASSYEVLDDYWRKIDYSSRRTKQTHCDDSLPRKWYRLLGPAGTRLPTSPAPSGSPNYNRNYCGTHGTAYMTEDHPTPEQGIVSRTVCFEWEDNSCLLSTNIQVAACYDNNEEVYYVYELTPTSSCSHAYCGLEGLGDSSGSAPSLCEEGWIHFGEHCYFVSNWEETFDEAKQECETVLPGSSLVSINSPEEQEFLEVNLFGSRWYYIGLHRVNSQWKWLDGSQMTYDNWKSGEPNNYGGSDYSAVINRRDSSYGEWIDNAGDVDMYYICKTSVEDVSLSATGGGKKFRDPSESMISGPANCNAPPPTFDKVECSKPGAVCLDGGSTPYEGNVYLEGKPICDDQWNLKSAGIVCSQLEYGKAKNTTGQSIFGQVNGPFAMTNVRCIGNEKTIKDCSHETEIKCIGAEAAGVRCETLEEKEIRVQKERELKECYLKGMCYDAGNTIGDYMRTESLKSCQELCVDHPECKFFTFYDSKKCYRRRGNNKESCSDAISGPRSCHKVHDAILITDDDCKKEGEICLRGGNKTSEGNVFIGGKPVCDDSWSLTDGEVACRQMGYAGAKRVTVESHFGYVSGEFSLDNVYCNGDESNLTSCQADSIENCAGDEGAGVVCDTRSPEKIKDETRKLKHCFMLDVLINGTTLHTELGVETSFDCQENCTKIPECTFFLYDSEEENCTLLKDEDRGSEKTSHYGMVAGPRKCIWTEDDCSCNGSSICLCGGSGPHEGNVFIEVEGKAKPVCDDHWSLVNANLVCKQLNFIQALNFTTKSHFGNVSMEFSVDNVFCKGYEDNITDCHIAREENCDGSEAAGVICDTRSQGVIDSENSLIEQSCFIDNAYYGESMRIYADNSLRNERRYPDSYEYVYLPSSVACQKLCSTTEECQTFRHRPSNGKCYLRRINLNDGSDNKYTSSDYISGPKQCENSDPVFSNPNCLNKNAVCLSGGSGTHDGNVFIEGKPICDDMWSLVDAQVVCKQLGYCVATGSTVGSRFGSVKGPFAFNEVECSGSEHNINECRSISKVKCLKSEAAGIVCEHFAETLEQGGCEGRPRPTPPSQQDCDRRDAVCLKGGSSENEGNVFVSGKPVCDDSWSTTDGDVVCKQLGFPGVERTTRESFFGSTSSVFSMDEVGCRGDETKITDCPFDSSDDCGGSEAAGVVCNARLFSLPQGDTCDNQGVLCLKGGVNQNEGNIMVSGEPVCDDEWDTRDGDVVCKQLGFSGVENVTTKSHFGRESSTFAMDDVACSGTESQLSDCRHTSRDDCGGDEAAGVICLPANEAPATIQQHVCGVPRINDSSSVFTRNDLFGAHNVLQNDCDSFHWYSSNQTNYWLAPARQVGHFIADLGCIYVIDAFQIKNTHNAQQNDRGTREFKISFSNSSHGPWKVLVENEELPDVRNLTCDYGLTNFSVLYPEHLRTGQFVKFSVVSWYGDGGGLQFFNVLGHPLGTGSSSSGALIAVVVVLSLVGVPALVGVGIFWWKQKGGNTANIPTLPSMYNRGASETKEGILSQTSVDSFSEIAARKKGDNPLA